MITVNQKKPTSKFAIILMISVSIMLSFISFPYSFSTVNAVTQPLSYNASISQNPQVYALVETIVISIENLSDTSGNTRIVENFEGYPGAALFTYEDSISTWSFEVTEGGYYNLEIYYYPLPGRGSDIERTLHINGALPFPDALAIVFQRYWRDSGPIKVNANGDDIRPTQEEVLGWRVQTVRDFSGFYNGPYLFYFEPGIHTLSLISLRDSMAIGQIRFVPPRRIPSYFEYLSSFSSIYSPQNVQKFLQAQHTCMRSSSLPAAVDRTSEATTPNSPVNHRINVISGINWRMPGQWISWTVNIEEAGFYHLTLRYNQNFVSGFSSARALYINGDIPFAEAGNIVFPHSSRWNVNRISDAAGNPFLFYFDKGEHEIRLEATTGAMADIIRRVRDCLMDLNINYRRIVQIIGTSPDLNRDYDLERFIPEVLDDLRVQKYIINDIISDLRAYGGEGESIISLRRVSQEIDRMLNRVDRIPRRINSFQISLSGMANWIVSSLEQPLTLDYLMISSPDIGVPRVDNGFFKNIWYEIMMFFASFRNDLSFSPDGENAGENPASIRVWMNTSTAGRDQAQTARNIVDNYFRPDTPISVEIQLVPPGTLLPSAFAGNAPDVALRLSTAEIVNYGLRAALVNLADFDDFMDIYDRFTPQTWIPYAFDGQVFGVPETMTFPMMFYRSDILKDEMGFTFSENMTWDDIIAMLPDILSNNMTVWIPPDTGMLFSFLRQHGSDFYREDSLYTALHTPEAARAFRFFTNFFTAYRLELWMDSHINRFRTGEAPIIIMDYTVANTLQVTAPEIRGLWGFLPLPGTIMEDGSFNHTGYLLTSGCVLMAQSENKEAAWEFIKWWTGAQAQARFGLEIESILGPAGRYTPANIEALSMLPWNGSELSRLMAQAEAGSALREMPGGYYTARLMNFAIRDVIIQGNNPRESLLTHGRRIDNEIRIKAGQLGIDMYTAFDEELWVTGGRR